MLVGARTGDVQYEPFSSRTRAEDFKGMVELAGQHWPEGWVKGRGVVQERTEDPGVS